MLPNFLISGAAKAGSYSLYHYLKQHPQICMSSEKEPAFFCHHWQKGTDYYEQFFAECGQHVAIGEATVEYMVDLESAARIATLLPDVRLIFILRDPWTRAASHYWHRVKRGQESRSLDAVLACGADSYPIRYGMYYQHLQRFLNYFKRQQMHFVIMEEMAEDPYRVFYDLFTFLGVDNQVQINFQGAVNRAKIPRNISLQLLLSKLQRNRLLQMAIPSLIRPIISSSYTRLKSANLRPFKVPPLEVRQIEYLNQFFKQDIEQLESLLGHSVQQWPSIKGNQIC